MRMSGEAFAACLKDCGVRPEIRERIPGREGCLEPPASACWAGNDAFLLEDLHRAQRRIDLMDLLIDSLKTDEE